MDFFLVADFEVFLPFVETDATVVIGSILRGVDQSSFY
jgi:hypothetical protein